MEENIPTPKNNLFKQIIFATVITAFSLAGLYLIFRVMSLEKLLPATLQQLGPASKPESTRPLGGKPTTISEQLAAQSKIKKFADYDQLREFLETYTTPSYWGLGAAREMISADLMGEEEAEALDAPLAKSLAVGESAAPGFSATNIQVAGVDEGDIIKTDGQYIYAVSKKNLFIIKAYPGEEAEILAKIAFKSTPQGIYINDDRLVIYGYNELIYDYPVYRRFPRRTNYTFFKIFDISNPQNPQQIRDLDLEGSYTNSRLIGDYVYFVTTTYSDIWLDEVPVPQILEAGEEMTGYHPDVYYFDFPYQSPNLTTVAAVNIKDVAEPPHSEVYLLSDNQNMYVSPSNIYITYTKYVSEYQLSMEVMKEVVYSRLSQKDQDKINKIEAVDNFILSPEEKMNKISYIIERHQDSLTDEEQGALEKEVGQRLREKYQDIAAELEKTVIHKITIDQDQLKYQTFGEVPGAVLDQFSLDEHDGYFRIATTKSRTWSQFAGEEQDSYSNLYILDDKLKIAGQVEKLAPGEQIYSVRFMQGRAYLVTFKQMDPLFVIDVADPKNPRVLGELKIPGFSDYLHPYDENMLIGFGRDTKENEWGGVTTGGLKFSLFNVSDVSKPTEIDTYIIGDASTDSIALSDHHAFLFSRDKNLLVVPVETWNNYPRPRSLLEDTAEDVTGVLPNRFRGALVFTVTRDGFELTGKINHREGVEEDESEYWYGYNYYDTTVKRSLYIDDLLYTFSNRYLKINDLDDLGLIKRLELQKKLSAQEDFEVIN